MGRPLKNGTEAFEKMEIFIENIDYFYDFAKNDEDVNISNEIEDNLKKYNLTVEDLNHTDFKSKLRDYTINEILKDEEE